MASQTPAARHPWLRIAMRELSGGLAGFWIYLACLALGAWAIASAGSITSALNAGLEQQSRQLLGGDAAITLSQRAVTAEERAWLDERGQVTEAAQVDLMARAPAKIAQVDVRGVDGAFPLVGSFTFDRDIPLADLLVRDGDVWGIAASESLVRDLGIEVGDTFSLGPITAELRAILMREPDRIGEPGMFQPRVIIAIDALREANLMQPGALFRTAYRILLKPEAAATFESEFNAKWDAEGLRYRGPDDALDGLRAMLDMLNTFMTVVGISALVAGGVGVSQATSSFLETRLDSIAALKALGADGGTIRAAYAFQLAALASLGALVGIGLGALTPWAVRLIIGDAVPLPIILGVYPLALLKAFALTLLAAAMFAAPPLGRARATPPAAIFRRESGDTPQRTPFAERFGAILAALTLVAIAMATSSRPLVVLALLAGAGVAYLILIGAAVLVRRLARRASLAARGQARLILASLGGTGSLAPVVAPALGLGLGLLTLITVIQTNLLGQIKDTAPAEAPSIIFRQIPASEVDAFDTLMREQGIDTGNQLTYRRAPVLIGRVITHNGRPVDESSIPVEQRWITRSEVPMTLLAQKPVEQLVLSGAWWPEDYDGPPQVSVEEEAAAGLGVKVGDRLGFRIFMREVVAEVTSIRKVDWQGFGANLAFILSPGAVGDFRPAHAAIVIIPPDREPALVAAVSARWPGVLAFQLRRTLETAADLFAQVSLVVTALASVVLAAGVLVLFGAFAAAARSRRRESALLKVFGASRATILSLYAIEFALAALLAVLLGAGGGIAAAYPVVILVFDTAWRFDWTPVLAVASITVFAAAAGGAAVGWATLSHSPARVLRSA
jgi:putative ABC transport system permease protein